MIEKEMTQVNGGNRHRKILIAIVIAIVIGFFMGGFFPDAAMRISILGKIFLNLLMMIVIPLVMFSIIVGITNLGDVRKIGTIGTRTIVYYFVTTSISVIIGMVLVNLVSPGTGLSAGEEIPKARYVISEENPKKVVLTEGKIRREHYNEKFILELTDQDIRGGVVSIDETSAVVREWEGGEPVPSGTGIAVNLPLAENIRGKEERTISSTLEEVIVGDKSTGKEGMIPRNIFNAMQRLDILPLIFFSLIFGAALSVLGERGKLVIEFISVLNDAVLRIVWWIMYFAPIGIFGIISERIGRAGGFQGFIPELAAVGKFSGTVLASLGFHGFVVLPLILILIGRRNPFRFAAGMGSALLNAFSTASSSATLPLTMESIESENGISRRTSSFVLPLGATINMDGTAMYEAVAAIFISQVYGLDLTIAQQAVIFITATLAAVGAAGIPEAGLVTMVLVLKAVDLPIEGIGLILAVDWLLDRFRTTINVWGDSVGAGVIETLESNDTS